MGRLGNFAGKVRRRGWRYALAVGRFYFWRGVWRWKRRLRAGGGGVVRRARASGERCGRFHFEAGEIAGIVARVPGELKARTVGEAEAVCAGRFAFRGLGEREFAGKVDWAARGMHRSWRWDLNRHAYFAALGRAYFYTGEARFVRRLVELWEDWVARNAAGRGVNWEEPFEVAARLQNWMWAYFLLGESGWVGEERLGRLRGAMREHAEFVAAHLEWHWPNNHLLLEAKALAEFGVVFREMEGAAGWRRRGLRVVEEEVAKQVLGDGVHAEMSPMYHRIVAGELAELAAICKRNGVALGRETEERIRGMGKFSEAMVREDGTTALFGDSAEEDCYLRFDGARKGRTDMNWWVWRGGRAENSESGGEAEGVRLEMFREAGYAVVRDAARGVHVVMDVGAFSRCEAADHAHCDALSFELYARGRAVVVDPGVYFAARDGERWRRWFRGTAAHNTVMVDGREQTELWGASDVKRRARVELIGQGCDGRGAWVAGECEPYWSERREVVHRREFRYAAGRVEVCDVVEGRGRRRVEWNFCFGAGVEVERGEMGELIARDEAGEELLRMRMWGVAAEWELRRGVGGEAGAGWASRDTVRLVRVWAARMVVEGELAVEGRIEMEVREESGERVVEERREESLVE